MNTTNKISAPSQKNRPPNLLSCLHGLIGTICCVYSSHAKHGAIFFVYQTPVGRNNQKHESKTKAYQKPKKQKKRQKQHAATQALSQSNNQSQNIKKNKKKTIRPRHAGSINPKHKPRQLHRKKSKNTKKKKQKAKKKTRPMRHAGSKNQGQNQGNYIATDRKSKKKTRTERCRSTENYRLDTNIHH